MTTEILTPAAFRKKFLQLEAEVEPKTCTGCGQKIGMALTLRGNRMPVDLDQDGRPVQSHFVTCPRADYFRKGKARKSERKQQAKASGGRQ